MHKRIIASFVMFVSFSAASFTIGSGTVLETNVASMLTTSGSYPSLLQGMLSTAVKTEYSNAFGSVAYGFGYAHVYPSLVSKTMLSYRGFDSIYALGSAAYLCNAVEDFPFSLGISVQAELARYLGSETLFVFPSFGIFVETELLRTFDLPFEIRFKIPLNVQLRRDAYSVASGLFLSIYVESLIGGTK